MNGTERAETASSPWVCTEGNVELKKRTRARPSCPQPLSGGSLRAPMLAAACGSCDQASPAASSSSGLSSSPSSFAAVSPARSSPPPPSSCDPDDRIRVGGSRRRGGGRLLERSTRPRAFLLLLRSRASVRAGRAVPRASFFLVVASLGGFAEPHRRLLRLPQVMLNFSATAAISK